MTPEQIWADYDAGKIGINDALAELADFFHGENPSASSSDIKDMALNAYETHTNEILSASPDHSPAHPFPVDNGAVPPFQTPAEQKKSDTQPANQITPPSLEGGAGLKDLSKLAVADLTKAVKSGLLDANSVFTELQNRGYSSPAAVVELANAGIHYDPGSGAAVDEKGNPLTGGGGSGGGSGSTKAPKAPPLTIEEQQALNRQKEQEAQVRQDAAVKAYLAQNPQYKDISGGLVQDPKTGLRYALTYNDSTGEVGLKAAAGIATPGFDPYGNLNSQDVGHFVGGDQQKALLAVDPIARAKAYADAHDGQIGSDSQQSLWLGTSIGNNTTQDYADLQKNRQTFADTGKLYQDFTANGGVGTNTPINVAKSLGSTASGITALTPNERNVYNAYGPSAFKPSAITTKMQDPQTGEMVPVIGGNSATPLPQAGTQVQVAGPDGTMQMVDAQQKALADFRNSTPEGQGQDNGGDVTQTGDYQRGAADAQAAYDQWVKAGMPTDKIPIPTGTSPYTSAWRQIWDQLEQQRAKGVQNQGGYITRYFGSPDTAPTGTPNIPVAQISNAPEAAPKPETPVDSYYPSPPKPEPFNSPPTINPPPVVNPIGRPVPDQPVQFQATGAENFVGVGYNGTHGKGFMNAGPVGVFDLNTGALRGVMGEAGGEKLISVPIKPEHPIDEKKRRLLAMMSA